MTPITAYVAIGGNLENPVQHVKEAVAELAALPDSALVARSSLYRSAPVGATENQPDYVNAVIALATTLDPYTLLAQLLEIEIRHGRLRTVRNAARTLDLDLLLYDEQTFQSSHLTIPHPRLHQRAFVLLPLVEIAPDITIPGRGKVADLLADCAGQCIERISDVSPSLVAR